MPWSSDRPIERRDCGPSLAAVDRGGTRDTIDRQSRLGRRSQRSHIMALTASNAARPASESSTRSGRQTAATDGTGAPKPPIVLWTEGITVWARTRTTARHYGCECRGPSGHTTDPLSAVTTDSRHRPRPPLVMTFVRFANEGRSEFSASVVAGVRVRRLDAVALCSRSRSRCLAAPTGGRILHGRMAIPADLI